MCWIEAAPGVEGGLTPKSPAIEGVDRCSAPRFNDLGRDHGAQTCESAHP